MIALTGRRWEKWVSGRGKMAEKHHPVLQGAHQGARDPRAKVCWDHRTAETKERWKEDSCCSDSKGEAHSSSPPPTPLTELLTVFCSFLDPSFILGCIRSQSHQVKPGESSRLSQNLSQHQECGEAGAGCALPFPGPHRAVDFVPPSLSLPRRIPSSPVPQSTDQEGMTIFMLRVTGIRGLWRNILGGSAQV